MARIIEWSPDHERYVSMTEAIHENLSEPLIYRDSTGQMADIEAACCRQCGEVTLHSRVVGNHFCATTEYLDRLADKGKHVFREIAGRTAGRG